ncbi:hypothetical protein HanXRQr2_Chr17g0801141 [Helianthus annuus]|uniref:Uncharacterized protein n=1 Tax=Helianthus annuus TaxID=4232 RepID=A0A251RPS5_HELAN|nr:hypothetical protein HanXRQr2_Chr17g0801141 [Helianthus annuus]KAJ0813023.1 hypothetical protein HanPSC8_Chr17g0768751 [Helianthus annuus]
MVAVKGSSLQFPQLVVTTSFPAHYLHKSKLLQIWVENKIPSATKSSTSLVIYRKH